MGTDQYLKDHCFERFLKKFKGYFFPDQQVYESKSNGLYHYSEVVVVDVVVVVHNIPKCFIPKGHYCKILNIEKQNRAFVITTFLNRNLQEQRPIGISICTLFHCGFIQVKNTIILQ